jgi:2-amino-4-hydroxy-6-hydroxymethyldihydropteridine diphosphokinase
MAHALIALGSNLGDRATLLQEAVASLAGSAGVRLIRHSSWVETAPIGGPAGQQPFLNGAVVVETSLEPEALHALLLDLECRAGRQRERRWGPRTLDLDLLLYDDCVRQTPKLHIPHPRLALRRFVLAPAAEVAPEMRHPQIGWTIRQLLDHLDHAVPYFAIAASSAAVAEWLADFASQAAGCRLIADPLAGLPPVHAAVGAANLGQAPPLEQARLRTPAIDRRTWPDPLCPAVSSFWIEQHLAEALTRNTPQPEFVHTAWQGVVEHVMPPKLLVVYTTPEMHTHPALAPPAWPKLLELARRPGLGPILWIHGAPPDEAAAEMLAAIDGMQPTLPQR